MKFFTRTRTVTRDRMQRPPVAAIDTSRRHYDDNGTTTYGVEKLSFFTVKMRFWVLVGVAAVVCVAVSGVESVGASVISDLKYLEHLNDLDVRNVEPELDDIHQQWPFVSIARPTEEDGEEEEEQQEDGEEEDAPGQKYVDPESLLQAAVLTRLEMGNNKHSQNFREMLFDRMDEGLRHAKENSERADHLSQYRRYKPFEQDLLEEARMYPDRNEEDDGRFHNDDAAYLNTDTYFADEDEVVKEPHHLPFPRPFFPRIAPVETPSFGDAFRDTLEEDQFPEESQKEVTIESHKPLHHHQVLFPRIAPVDFHKNYDLDDIGFGNNKQHQHAEYQFKEGEEFPETVKFEEVPVVEDLTEFGVRPNDPRFYRDAEDTEKKTAAPNVEEEPVHPYILNSAYVSKSKLLNSKSDFHNPKESLPEREDLTNREVQVVPFKPDQGEDSAGVYIIAIVAGISAAATVGLIAVGIGWYNLQKHMKNAEDTDYPSYGIVGPNKDYEKKNRDEAGDRKLAQSAQMYHYQHQKQQIIAMGRNTHGNGSQSDTDEEEDEEGNYTVYECPGLASIEGPLEVKNPMFDDDQLLSITPTHTPSKPEDHH